MEHYGDLIRIVLMVTCLPLFGSSRFMGYIRIVAFQGILTGVLALFAKNEISVYSVSLSAGIILLKGFVFPWLLNQAIREADVRREEAPFVGYMLSIIIGSGCFGIALWLGAWLMVPFHAVSTLPVSSALFIIFTGFFFITSRRQALSQVLGYLTLENGIYAFGLAFAYEEPFLVELGMLLDVFAAVFVMGIAVFHINREFEDIDTERLSVLKD